MVGECERCDGCAVLDKKSVLKSQTDSEETCSSYSGDSQPSVDFRDQSFFAHRGDYPLAILGKKDRPAGIDRADGPWRRPETRASQRVSKRRRGPTCLVLSDFFAWAPLIVWVQL